MYDLLLTEDTLTTATLSIICDGTSTDDRHVLNGNGGGHVNIADAPAILLAELFIFYMIIENIDVGYIFVCVTLKERKGSFVITVNFTANNTRFLLMKPHPKSPIRTVC